MPDDFYVDLPSWNNFQADNFEKFARQQMADAWANVAQANVPQLAADAWEQHVTSQLPNIAAALTPVASPKPVEPVSTQPALSPISGPAPAAPSPAGSPPTSVPSAQPGGDVLGGIGQAAGGIADMIRQTAKKYGIDPETAIRVAQSEGGLDDPVRAGDNGSSFGPFQLHYGNVAQGGNAVAGLGDAFTKATGLDARDPNNVGAAIDFALQNVAKNGWGAFHGAARAGIGAFDGIGQAVKDATQSAQQGIQDFGQGAQQTATAVLDKAKDFIGQPYVWGGKSPTQGFDCSGLAGYLTTGQPESTTTLYGKSSTISQQDAQPGDLVFYNMNSSDPHMQHVAIYLGGGKILQSGGTQANVNIGDANQAIGSAPEFRRVGPGGAPVQAQLAQQDPALPSPADPPSMGAQISKNMLAQQTAGLTMGAMQPSDAASSGGGGSTNPLQQIGDTISTAITSGLSKLFGGDPGGAVRGAMDTVGQALPDISQSLPQPTEGSPLARSVAGQQLNPTEQLQAGGQTFRLAEQAREQATENLNPLRDAPVVGGAINALTDPLTFVNPTSIAGNAAAGAVGGFARSADDASPLDVLGNVAGGAAIGGGLAAGLTVGPRVAGALARNPELRQFAQSEAGEAPVEGFITRSADDIAQVAEPQRLSDEDLLQHWQSLGQTHTELGNQIAELDARSAEAFNPGLKARYQNEANRLRDQQARVQEQADFLEEHGYLKPDDTPDLPQQQFSEDLPFDVPQTPSQPTTQSPSMAASSTISQSPLFRKLQQMRGTPEQQAALRPAEDGYAGNVLLDKFPEETRGYMTDLADTFKEFAGQRRGVITDDQAMQNGAEKALGTTIDQWTRTPAGRAFNQEQAIALGQTLAKTGREYDQLRQSVVAARATGSVTPTMEAELADKALQFATLEGVRSGAAAEAGRALRAFRAELQGAIGSGAGPRPDGAIKQAFKVLGGTDQFDQWVQEFSKLDPEDTVARAQMLQSLTKPTLWDKLSAWRYASMLSSWQTHIQNAASNTAQATARPLRLAAGGYLREAGADVQGMLEAIPEAGAIFARTLKTGVSASDLTKTEGIRPRPFGNGPVGRAISLPTDLLAAADDFFKQINYQGAYRSAAYREAAGDMAKYEQLLSDPRPDLVDEANQAAKLATFQEDPGEFVNRLLKLRQTPGPGGQAVQFILPFIRTPANITRQGLGLAVKPATGTYNAVRAGLAGDTRTARLEAGQAAIASLFEAGLAVKAMNGELSGEGPQDPAARNQLRSQGWQDHSIKLGDKWLSYTQWGPASIPMAAIASAAEGWREGERPGQNLVSDVAARTTRGIFSATYLQSLGDVLKAISGDGEAISYLQNLGASTAGSLVPFGGALSAGARTLDPVEHQPSKDNPLLGTLQQFETRLPGLRQQVPVKQDVLGRDLPTAASQTPLAGVTRISQSRPDDALQLLGGVGMRVPPAPDNVSIKPGFSVTLKDDDKRRFMDAQGQLLQAMLTPLANDRAFQTAPEPQQRKILQQIIDKAHEAAGKQVLGGIGADIGPRLAADQAKRQATVPGLQRP